MARPLRIEFEGVLYHEMARGNARGDIFMDDEDRQTFVDNPGRAYARFVAGGVKAPDTAAGCLRAGFVGGEAFVERMLENVDTGTLSGEIPRKDRPARSLETIAAGCEDQNGAIREAYATTACSLTEIARHFGIHVSTVSRVVRDGAGAGS